MPWYNFLAWAATQGFKNIKLLRQAYNSFKGKIPGKEVILKTARNLYDDLIKKTPTKDITKKIRQDLKDLGVGTKDRPYPGFIPKIVKPIKVPEQTKNILNIKSTLKGRPVKVVPEPKVGDAMKVFEEKVIGPAKVIYGRFPKKPPRKPKADGGSIDKALSGRSRDI